MRAVSEPMIVAVSATAKMFVGDIVETGMHILYKFQNLNWHVFSKIQVIPFGSGRPSNSLGGLLMLSLSRSPRITCKSSACLSLI